MPAEDKAQPRTRIKVAVKIEVKHDVTVLLTGYTDQTIEELKEAANTAFKTLEGRNSAWRDKFTGRNDISVGFMQVKLLSVNSQDEL